MEQPAETQQVPEQAAAPCKPADASRSAELGLSEEQEDGYAKALCGRHFKLRAVDSLMIKPDGSMVCKETSRCKADADVDIASALYDENNGITGTAMCSLHNRIRSIPNLAQGADGNFHCLLTHACRAVPEGQDFSHVCAIHGRKRSSQFLVEAEDGQWTCYPPNECKVSTPDDPSARVVQLCAAHNRNRQVQFMDLGPDGLYYCKSDNLCRVATGDEVMAMCSAHNRRRQIQYLQQDAFGNLVCCLDNLCKGANKNDPHNQQQIYQNQVALQAVQYAQYARNYPQAMAAAAQQGYGSMMQWPYAVPGAAAAAVAGGMGVTPQVPGMFPMMPMMPMYYPTWAQGPQ